MSEQHSDKVLFTVDESFRFSCHSGLACYNSCCRDINIFLSPYDVLRMRRATGLSCEDFLNKYTLKFVGDEGLPLVVLKMMEDQQNICPFVRPSGCSIYQDRPWSCRMFPVFPISSEEQEYLIEEKTNCLGFKEDKQTMVREWKQEQDIDTYDKMNKQYKGITGHEFFERGNKLDPGRTRALYRACYELDEFKKLLFGSKFFDIYDVEKELIDKLREDEEELLNFSYSWIRFSLFGENTLKLKDKEMDKLLHSGSGASS